MNPRNLVLVTFSFCLCITALGQDLKTFSVDLKATEVDANSAKQKGSELAALCKFGSAYFTRADIDDLINVTNAVGVRFYISKEKKDQQYVDVMAVAIDKSGNELAKSFQRQYLMAKALNTSNPNYAKGLNRYEAEQQVKNVNAGDANLEPYVSFLGIEDLNNLIATGDGLRVYPSAVNVEGSSYRSMSFGSVTNAKGQLQDANNIYLESIAPCPIQCGGDGDKAYLWNR